MTKEEFESLKDLIEYDIEKLEECMDELSAAAASLHSESDLSDVQLYSERLSERSFDLVELIAGATNTEEGYD